ncbi:MAG TPA: hypothetical protein VN758_08955 [Solirubrobacterales bacterium]|nr:hypothetical protein [Solirubrobacterales bacterium]
MTHSLRRPVGARPRIARIAWMVSAREGAERSPGVGRPVFVAFVSLSMASAYPDFVLSEPG